jgi:hypothetical protein
MRRLLPLVLLTSLGLLSMPRAGVAQLLADTTFTWQGYGRNGQCQVEIYRAGPEADDRTHVAVLREVAANQGPSTLQDARLLAELVGRQFGFDPAEAYFIFHWGGFSFDGADPDADREILLRASFRRTRSQRLGSPHWRVITREEVEAYTDRQFR